jgi:hypothetical protein
MDGLPYSSNNGSVIQNLVTLGGMVGTRFPFPNCPFPPRFGGNILRNYKNATSRNGT